MNRTSSLQMRVAIVDDHNLVCAALTELLKLDGRFQVVAQAHDGISAKALFARDDIDVILLDLELPGAHGLEALKWKSGGACVCILSMYTDPHFVTEAFKAGAFGYISKHA